MEHFTSCESRPSCHDGSFLRGPKVSTAGLTVCSYFLSFSDFSRPSNLRTLRFVTRYQVPFHLWWMECVLKLPKFQVILSRNCSNLSRFPGFLEQILENLSSRNFFLCSFKRKEIRDDFIEAVIWCSFSYKKQLLCFKIFWSKNNNGLRVIWIDLL